MLSPQRALLVDTPAGELSVSCVTPSRRLWKSAPAPPDFAHVLVPLQGDVRAGTQVNLGLYPHNTPLEGGRSVFWVRTVKKTAFLEILPHTGPGEATPKGQPGRPEVGQELSQVQPNKSVKRALLHFWMHLPKQASSRYKLSRLPKVRSASLSIVGRTASPGKMRSSHNPPSREVASFGNRGWADAIG